MTLTPSPVGAIAVVVNGELVAALDIYGDEFSPLTMDSVSLPSIKCC